MGGVKLFGDLCSTINILKEMLILPFSLIYLYFEKHQSNS